MQTALLFPVPPSPFLLPLPSSLLPTSSFAPSSLVPSSPFFFLLSSFVSHPSSFVNRRRLPLHPPSCCLPSIPPPPLLPPTSLSPPSFLFPPLRPLRFPPSLPVLYPSVLPHPFIARPSCLILAACHGKGSTLTPNDLLVRPTRLLNWGANGCRWIFLRYHWSHKVPLRNEVGFKSRGWVSEAEQGGGTSSLNPRTCAKKKKKKPPRE